MSSRACDRCLVHPGATVEIPPRMAYRRHRYGYGAVIFRSCNLFSIHGSRPKPRRPPALILGAPSLGTVLRVLVDRGRWVHWLPSVAGAA